MNRKNLRRRACAKTSLHWWCRALHSEIKVLPAELPTTSMPNGIVILMNSKLSSVAKLFIKHGFEKRTAPREKKIVAAMLACVRSNVGCRETSGLVVLTLSSSPLTRRRHSVFACVLRGVRRIRYLYALCHQAIIATQGVHVEAPCLPRSRVRSQRGRCFASSVRAKSRIRTADTDIGGRWSPAIRGSFALCLI
jgi:hypothetical protein